MDLKTRALIRIRSKILEEEILPKIIYIRNTTFYARNNIKKLIEPLVSSAIYLSVVYYLIFIASSSSSSSSAGFFASITSTRTVSSFFRLPVVVFCCLIGSFLLTRLAYIFVLLAVRLSLNFILQLKPELAIDTRSTSFRLVYKIDLLIEPFIQNYRFSRSPGVTSSIPSSSVVSRPLASKTLAAKEDAALISKHLALNRTLYLVFPNYISIREALSTIADPEVDLYLEGVTAEFSGKSKVAKLVTTTTSSSSTTTTTTTTSRAPISNTLRKFINYKKKNKTNAYIKYIIGMTKELPVHAYIRPLTISDLDQVEALETEGFPPAERASREKLAYRLKNCPEYCAGIFIREFDVDLDTYKNPTFEALPPGILQGLGLHDRYLPREAESGETSSSAAGSKKLPLDLEILKKVSQEIKSTKGTEKLIAQVHGTKTASGVVTEESMMVPELDKGGHKLKSDAEDARGHVETGRTIAIHGLVVKPEFQGQSLGTILLKDYIQRLTTLHVADQIALLAHESIAPFYKRLDFVERGPSKVQSCGGNWVDLVRELADAEEFD